MFGVNLVELAKAEVKKFKLKGHSQPAVLEALDAIEAAIEQVAPFLARLDVNDLLNVVKVLDPRGKFTDEEKQQFAKGFTDLVKFLPALKAEAEVVEEELKK